MVKISKQVQGMNIYFERCICNLRQVCLMHANVQQVLQNTKIGITVHYRIQISSWESQNQLTQLILYPNNLDISKSTWWTRSADCSQLLFDAGCFTCLYMLLFYNPLISLTWAFLSQCNSLIRSTISKFVKANAKEQLNRKVQPLMPRVSTTTTMHRDDR